MHRFRTGNDAKNLAQVQLEGARVLARQGDVEQARRLLRAAVQDDPACADAWLELARLATEPITPAELAKALKRARAQFIMAGESISGQAQLLGAAEATTASSKNSS